MTMKERFKKQLPIMLLIWLILCVGIITIWASFVFFSSLPTSATKACTIETTATMYDIVISTREDGDQFAEYGFEYYINDVKYRGTELHHRNIPFNTGNEKLNQQVTILYDQNNPKNFIVENSSAWKIYHIPNLLFVGWLIPIIGVGLIIRAPFPSSQELKRRKYKRRGWQKLFGIDDN